MALLVFLSGLYKNVKKGWKNTQFVLVRDEIFVKDVFVKFL